jgi:hypothetical protein
MAAAIDQHGAITRRDQRRNLIAPVAAMPKAAMQQDHGSFRPVRRVPDSSTVVFHKALIDRGGQGRSAMRLETFKVVVV